MDGRGMSWCGHAKKAGIYLPIHLWDLNMGEKERDQIIFIEVNNNLPLINHFAVNFLP